MATARPNLGLQIALMIFVLITIALAVSTFMYFKQAQEAEVAKKTADENAKKALDAKGLADQDVERMKTLVGKGQNDKVSSILDDFDGDKKLYAATYTEALQTYPEMLRHLLDDKLQLNEKITQLSADVAKAQAARKKQQDDDEIQLAKKQESLNALTDDYKKAHSDFQGEVATFEGKQAGVRALKEEKDKEVTRLETQVSKEKEAHKAAIAKEKENTKAALVAIEPYKSTEFTPAIGHVVRVNQREHTVWIDLGQIDGVQPQMIFTVWDKSVTNTASKSAKTKGTIEVIRILDPHMAEARITDDHITDPILREDKIWSETFRPGLPNHYGVDGVIDIAGDGGSDLPKLVSLIHANGGLIDAVVDENGTRNGKLTPSTKLLVVGKAPLDTKNADAQKNYNALLDEAKRLHIPTMQLRDFLASMGYQGRERSVNFDRGLVTPEAPAARPDDTFRKRP